MMSQISEAEAVVMEVLWNRHPQGADEVVAALADRDWAEPTIKTLLNRLLTKGAISASRDGRRYLYSPVLQRQAWVAEQSSGLLDKLFAGRVAPLVAHFSERGELSAQDIAELKKLIQELDRPCWSRCGRPAHCWPASASGGASVVSNVAWARFTREAMAAGRPAPIPACRPWWACGHHAWWSARISICASARPNAR